MQHRRLLLEWCVIVLVTMALVAGLVAARATERIDHVFYDSLVGFRAPPPSDHILLVTIDDSSIAAIGRWPWPRAVHARMLERLEAARPAAIAYDVLFTEPGGSADDVRLAAAEKTLGSVVLPVLFEAPGHGGRPIDATPPVAPIGTAARAIGHVALLPDDDGTARSVLLSLPADGRVWLHLMEWAYRIAFGHPSAAWQHHRNTITIPFQPYSGGFRTISFADVLAGQVPTAFLRGRIVLVGVTAAGLGDRYVVPMRRGGPISGLEVQANLLNTLIAHRSIVTPARPVLFAAALLPSLLLLICFWRLGPGHAFAVSLTLIALGLVVPAVLLALAGIWLPPTPGLIGLLLVYPLWGWRRLQAVDRAIGQELTAFAAEAAPVPPRAPRRAPLDPVGGQTARLRDAITDMRDMRQLVSDTIESVDDPLLVTDLDDRILLANRPAAALFGSSLAGRQAAALLADAAETEVTPDAMPAELAVGDRAFSLRRSSLCGSDGERRGWIVHLMDITATRAAEREREAALEFLSHDMRSPQSSIITLIEHHRHALGDADIAPRIAALARRTLTLADNFVELARLDVARFAPDELDLGDVLTEAADDLWSQASSRNIRIELEGTDQPRFMLGERDTLRRMFANLLDNAVKFSADDGVVRCRLTGDAAGWIECVIDDDGPGMPPERCADLFKRYGYRRKAPGSRHSAGLGLAYVGAAVARHHGEINCTPRAPHGTRFILRFAGVP